MLLLALSRQSTASSPNDLSVKICVESSALWRAANCCCYISGRKQSADAATFTRSCVDVDVEMLGVNRRQACSVPGSTLQPTSRLQFSKSNSPCAAFLRE